MVGNYTLIMEAKTASNDKNVSSVQIDKVVIEETKRLTEQMAKEEDAKFTTTPAPTTSGPTTSAPMTTATVGPVSSGSQSALIVMICIVVVLTIALIVVSVKYYKLRNEGVGNYSVSTTMTRDQGGSGPMPYENPSYTGEHMAASDRYGTIRD